MNTTNMTNALKDSTSDPMEEGMRLRTKAINASVVVMSFTVIVLNCIAVYTLRKCRRMPFQIKWLSCNLLITDTLLHVFLFCLSACVLQLGQSFLDQVFYIRIVVGADMVLVSTASVSGLILERLMALTKTMTYTKLLTKTKVTLLLIYIWLPHMIIPLTIFVMTVYLMCDLDISLRTCNTWLVLLPFRLVIAFFYAVYHSFIIYAYVIIFKIMKRHAEAITRHTCLSTKEKRPSKKEKNRNSDTTTHKVIRIVLVFELINIPMFTHSLIFAFVPAFHVDTIETLFNVVSYLCSCSNSLVNLYLYVWKIKECRLVFLNTFFSWNKSCQTMAQALRLEVYPFLANDSKTIPTLCKY